MEVIIQEAGEWLDKEPRADGKPRRWKPGEVITVDPSRLISPTQEDKPGHLPDDIRS
jgi:hypothetical protein